MSDDRKTVLAARFVLTQRLRDYEHRAESCVHHAVYATTTALQDDREVVQIVETTVTDSIVAEALFYGAEVTRYRAALEALDAAYPGTVES